VDGGLCDVLLANHGDVFQTTLGTMDAHALGDALLQYCAKSPAEPVHQPSHPITPTTDIEIEVILPRTIPIIAKKVGGLYHRLSAHLLAISVFL
jgi:hypothetical protein